jgi:hypothetical protein
MVNEGRPEEISTSTSTIAPSSPTTAQVVTLASMLYILYHKTLCLQNIVRLWGGEGGKKEA